MTSQVTTPPHVAPTISGAAVHVERLEKRFGDVVAVDSVSFGISAGEFVTLLGPSGSGKTTTLMMIAGFEIPTDGQISIDNVSVVFEPPNKRNLGMVFQNYALFPHMTVFDNIAFPLKMRKWEKADIDRAVRKALGIVNLTGYEQRLPRQLSGGQQQRVAFARAIVFEPRVLLMDEPLGALDKQLRQRLQLEIKRIQVELGITVIYVTHDQEEALVMSDRIIVMDSGLIQQIGPPDELYNRPANEFVAGFLGESNFLPGVMVENSGQFATVTIGEKRVDVPLSQDLLPGDNIRLTVRPEKLWLTEDDSVGGEGINTLSGVVRNTVFVGDHQRIEVVLPDDMVLIVKQSERYGMARYSPGTPVTVHWHVIDCQGLLPEKQVVR